MNLAATRNSALVQCPQDSALAFTAIWYHPVDSAAFTICSRCYEDQLRHSPFAVKFAAKRLAADPHRFCLWNTERVTQLKGQHLSNSNWDSIHRYMIARREIPNCTGPTTAVTAEPNANNYRWYSLRNSEIDGFVCCKACYEDTVCATTFADRFILEDFGVNGQSATCDMCIGFIKKAILQHSPSQNWATFIEWARARMKIPACKDLTGAACASTLWYMPNPPIHGVLVCGACFHDGADLSPLASHFIQIQIPESRKQEVWECANSQTQLGMLVAWNEACAKKIITLWHNAAHVIPGLPPCTKDGIRNGIWYTLDGCPDFKICGRCLTGIMQTFGLRNYFRQIGGPADGSPYICDLFPGVPRALSYFPKLDEAVILSDFSIFHSFVARLAPLATCPKDGPYKNRRWYCGEEATICESCFEEAIRDTSLAHTLTLRQRPDECICDAYSPRMRGLWNKACAENNIESFNLALRERMQVYLATVPRMRNILEVTKMRMNTQSTLFMSSIMLQGANNIVAASRTHNPYLYGNSHIGYNWETPSGAQGAMQFQQALNMNIAPTGDMAEMKQLGDLWRRYE
ncbi:hypothetical protein UA08_04965 [Talaromyces atroroseus]|uniref:Integral membrane protein n=1 Tax=Talaromyces atroroseus TaxID=1441469 RepID=A0A225AK55_TALAT|nr:hypothetical protein UA08_04965 [Talaromyces atroroseus]OKL59763.1 hypothetical protein UA08_04965 [Talaromyces atroroseus]